MAQKDLLVAYVLWFFLGALGIHRFYLDRPVSGIIYLLTGGICGLGWLIDLCLIPSMVESCNQEYQTVYHTTTEYTYTTANTTPVVYQPQQQQYVPPPQQSYQQF